MAQAVLPKEMQQPKPIYKEKFLAQEQIEQLKDYVKTYYSTNLFRSIFKDMELHIYWRGMSRLEYEQFMIQVMQVDMDATGFQLERELCLRIIMHPTAGKGPNMLDLTAMPAGVASHIFKEFMDKMGFNPDKIITDQL